MNKFEELKNKVAKYTVKPKIVVPCPYDRNILEALSMAEKNNLAKVILVGDKKRIYKILEENRLKIEFSLVHADEDLEAIKEAYSLILKDEADIIMKGLVQTKDFMGVLLSNKTFVKRKLLTHVAIYNIQNMDRLLFVTDSSIMIDPTVDQKRIIIDNALDLLNDLNIVDPKVAIISSIEVVNAKIKSTVDAMELTKLYEKEDIKVYGPLSIDNAISKEAAKVKKIENAVSGNADLLVMPNLDAGNIFCKGLTYVAGIDSAGIVMGGNKPIILTSRAASPKEKFNSIVIASVMANKNRIK